MADLVVITPSRGRPKQLRALIDAVTETAGGDVEVLPCLDRDDPDLEEYRHLLPPAPRLISDRRTLSGWTNHAARVVLDQPDTPRYLASLGDDHRPRTWGWDVKLIDAIEALPGPGFAYGNDLYQGPRLPTAWVASADAVRALGWMMLPTAEHMYVDTALLELGQAAGRIAYRPDVIIEHLHPYAGKAAWDVSYRETNTRARFAADQAAYEAWRTDQMPADAAALAALVPTG